MALLLQSSFFPKPEIVATKVPRSQRIKYVKCDYLPPCGKWHIVEWESLFKAFLVEAEWFASGNIPRGEDYLNNGIISSGVHIVLVHIFFLLGQRLTQENVEIIDGFPRIISSVAKFLRLWDDFGIAEV
ncbi:unnamed protein product [Lupinus luteus]|uniref:Terpene synthase metal-binding domain-containing protein n=1 Tax=Lupinus luteus TaxID=3873 RepID=A0AAV1WKL7_LUPLU